MNEDAATDLLASEEIKDLENVKIVGLMGMATFTQNTSQIAQEFQKLKGFFDQINCYYKIDVLSMGMSGDYSIAIDNGSTMVRVGSKIFGERNYNN